MVGVSPGRTWEGWSPSKAAIRTRRRATRRPANKLGARATTLRGGEGDGGAVSGEDRLAFLGQQPAEVLVFDLE